MGTRRLQPEGVGQADRVSRQASCLCPSCVLGGSAVILCAITRRQGGGARFRRPLCKQFQIDEKLRYREENCSQSLEAKLGVGIRSAKCFSPLRDGRRGKEGASQVGIWEQRCTGGLEQKMHSVGQSGPEWGWTWLFNTPKELPWG